jgi:hypothetical protein
VISLTTGLEDPEKVTIAMLLPSARPSLGVER